jgi:lipopolysaccharide O-acetyltransferase
MANIIHIFCAKIKTNLFQQTNNRKAIRFFLNHHSYLNKPLHCQFNANTFKIGEDVRIDSGARLDCYKEGLSLPRLSIGSHTRISFFVTILCAQKVSIGENCLFGSYVFITDENHGTDINSSPFWNQKLKTAPVIIGNNVWLGEKTIVLPGVTIGNNVVVGAGSVVTHDIPSFSIAVGNPAKVIKFFDLDKKEWVKA